MSEKVGEYEFGGKRYVQTKMVWGQVKQLNALIKGIQFPTTGLSPAGLIDLLGEKVPLAVAILVYEEGTSLKDKDLDALVAQFEFELPFDTVIKVIEDFFVLNPIISVIEKLKVGIQALQKQMTAAGMTPLTAPSDSSQKGTSPDATT